MLNFNVMQAIILSSLRIKNLFQALDCMPEIERPKRMPFLDGTSFNSVPFEINYDCLFAALRKKASYTEFPQSKSNLGVFP